MLEIKKGYDVADNNLLACPRYHIEAVLNMLEDQPQPAKFTGGLEARRIEKWFIDRLITMRLKTAFTAYDNESQRNHIERAVKMILDQSGWSSGIARNKLQCYVLVGFDGDTIQSAVDRLEFIKELGIRPFPMFYQPPLETRVQPSSIWKSIMRQYLRPNIIYSLPEQRLDQETMEI